MGAVFATMLVPLGCGASRGVSPAAEREPVIADTGGAAEAGSPFAPDLPVATAEEARAGMEAALRGGLPHAVAFAEAYDRTAGDPGDECPGSLLPDEDPMSGLGPWFTPGCESDDGTRFEGDINDAVSSETLADGGTCVVRRMAGEGSVAGPRGAVEFAGQLDMYVFRTADEHDPDAWASWSATFLGRFLVEDQPGWLGLAEQAALTVSWGGTDGPTVIDGGLGSEGHTVYFDGVLLEEAACGIGSSGQLRLRDPTGFWWSLALDGGCEGCGRLSFEGTDHGEVCLDGALQDAALDLGSEPWSD